jgi:hypothetical protein
MHIPKPKVLEHTDLHLMNFAEAQVLPFTGEHQPSFEKSALYSVHICSPLEEVSKSVLPGLVSRLQRSQVL